MTSVLNMRYWVRHEAVSIFPTITGRGLLKHIRHTFHHAMQSCCWVRAWYPCKAPFSEVQTLTGPLCFLALLSASSLLEHLVVSLAWLK